MLAFVVQVSPEQVVGKCWKFCRKLELRLRTICDITNVWPFASFRFKYENRFVCDWLLLVLMAPAHIQQG